MYDPIYIAFWHDAIIAIENRLTGVWDSVSGQEGKYLCRGWGDGSDAHSVCCSSKTGNTDIKRAKKKLILQ